MLEFTYPLLLLIGGGLIFALIFLPKFRKKGLGLNVSYWKEKVRFFSRKTLIVSFLTIIISGFIALALADPQIVIRKRVSSPIVRAPVMVVMDVSGSMVYGQDYQSGTSGFEKAKEVFYNIINRNLGVSFGLLLYSDENYIARDFTPNPELLKDVLEDEELTRKLGGATETDLALTKARIFLTKGEKFGQKAIILISDLEDNLSDVGKEIRRGIKEGIKFYVIVIERDPVSASMKMASLKKEVGQEIKMVWSEDFKGIDEICKEISQMEGILKEEKAITSRQSLVPFLLSATLILIVITVILSETLFRKVP